MTIISVNQCLSSRINIIIKIILYHRAPNLERKILLSYMKRGALPEKLYRKRRSSSSINSQFYRLLNIHKVEVTLRPIVSFIDSPTYKLSKYLSPFCYHWYTTLLKDETILDRTQLSPDEVSGVARGGGRA